MLKGMSLNPLIVTFLYVTPYPYSKNKKQNIQPLAVNARNIHMMKVIKSYFYDGY
jgi:hypothetical protein